MPLTPGTRLGTYEIVAPLGAGGMGEVYRARDLRLGREVALKVLPADVATHPDRLARFEREARTVAALSHPNIVVLHSVEDDGDIRFLTMELVEGQSLDQLVTPGGLPVARLLELGISLSDALTSAHEKGVIHRDLKPANVMVNREGRVKVLDFGLAKLAADGAEPGLDSTQAPTVVSPLSSPGLVVGTVPYMAPEQIRGETADARSDLFALGIILHELAAGRRPFTGASLAEVSSAILRDTPEPLGNVRPDLQGDLERIVSRCLEKNPRDRFQTALDVCNELRRAGNTIGSGERAGPVRPASREVASIAVLPFVNRSANAEDEYFSDGLADELLNMLVKTKGLRVSARASSFHFKGKDVPLAEVGRALNVTTLLDGSVRKAGDRVRISVQLMKASTGDHLWSESYDRKLDDIFAVQDDIAQSVVKELRATLLAESQDAPSGSPSHAILVAERKEGSCDPESYDLYLRGRYLFGASDDGPVRAQEMFRHAIERSPRFALAYSGLGESYVAQSWLSSRDRDITVSQAKGALTKALALDDRLCEARVLAGAIKLFFDWDWVGAESEFRLALELNPGSDLAHREFGAFLSLMGRFDEGLEAARMAQALDPLSVNATHEVGYQLLALGRLAEAAAEFRKAIDLNPTWTWGNIKLGTAYSAMGEHEKAMACVRRADELMGGAPGTPLSQAWLGTIASAAGDTARVRNALIRLDEQSRTGYVDPFVVAWMHYALHDHDAMFASLERAHGIRSPLMVFLVQARRFLWREAGADERYEGLIRRMGFGSGASPRRITPSSPG
ncbi:MAG: protein kinase [Candidatus Eisenbacteria bacterium]|nr:protein kinase [Candidatus Eisenbacteria bacterium]